MNRIIHQEIKIQLADTMLFGELKDGGVAQLELIDRSPEEAASVTDSLGGASSVGFDVSAAVSGQGQSDEVKQAIELSKKKIVVTSIPAEADSESLEDSSSAAEANENSPSADSSALETENSGGSEPL